MRCRTCCWARRAPSRGRTGSRSSSSLYEAFKAGRLARAWELQKAIALQSPFLIPRTASSVMGSRIDHSGVGYLKARFSLMSGIEIGPPMPPYLQASPAEMEKAGKGIRKIETLLAKE